MATVTILKFRETQSDPTNVWIADSRLRDDIGPRQWRIEMFAGGEFEVTGPSGIYEKIHSFGSLGESMDHCERGEREIAVKLAAAK